MNRTALVFVLAIYVAGTGAAAQSDTVVCTAEQTAAPVDARYEILRGGGRVLKVDKTTGYVWALEHSTGFASRPSWRPVAPPDDRQPAVVNYQVVLSPTSGETLMLNLHSGNTWLLRDSRSSLEWVPVVPER